MRLTKIKLSGFKSFAEPVTIDFSGDMVGIVGPNGCGKSNVVDSVRWVMGETSRHIRATTLEDVIFNGTTARKPLGQASVDLVFDNSGGAVDSKFAQYTELSLSRMVTRDRDSKYHLNGSRCRRRDIADIFLGTGLGTNSYAVIEQGMIARVVEAKPDEMRAYIEEAAGVSQYKERRRDTENRIRHTRDNLARVMDIREEVDKQVRKLRRQVKSAERFKQLRKDKEKFAAELLLLRYRQREEQRRVSEKEVETKRLNFEKIQALLRQLEADLEKKRAISEAFNDELNHIKEDHYRLGARIQSEEQDMENRKHSIERLRKESEEEKTKVERNVCELGEQQSLLAEKESRCNNLEKNVRSFRKEIERLREERTLARQTLHEQAQKRQGEIDRIGGEIAALRDRVHALVEALNVEQSKGSDVQGRLSSLEALQEAALHSEDGTFARWMEAAGLKRKDRLVENIRVADGWERAVEAVLGSLIAGIEVASLERHAAQMESFDKGMLVLFEPCRSNGDARNTLADKVLGSGSLRILLGCVRIVDSLEQALEQRASLSAHESLITRTGVWVGSNWIKLNVPDKDGEGVLLRERQIEELRGQLETSAGKCESLKGDIENARVDLARKEAQRDEVQSRLSMTLKEAAALEGDAENAGEFALEEARNRLREARNALHRTEMEHEAAKSEHAAATQKIKHLRELNEELTQRHDSLDATQLELEKSMSDVQKRLEALLIEHGQGEQQLARHNRKLADLQSETKALERRRVELDDEDEARRKAFEQVKTELQVTIVRSKDAREEFGKLDFTSEQIEENMESGVSIETQEEKLVRVQAGIDRLGSINLVALEEFDELTERKEYIDSQHDDLTRALKTLEEVMRKIDKETRERFKATFDRVNENLHDIFPRLFGSGEARLELTENDLMTTGVSIIVRPPGKRRVSINLLSGGEKALAALAVVFSIFKLNPAPFCLLDEVDAPLDEQNVERFCDLLKYLSSRVQFIVITHNKISMEYMSRLIGVTMQEPGVSRLVAVDIEEAAKMATA